MTLRIVRLGTARLPQEGTRIGTVRRLPRGVRKERYAADDWFDVWYPDLSPSAGLVAQARAAATDAEWDTFVRAFRAEMDAPSPRRTLDLLAALSQDRKSAVEGKSGSVSVDLGGGRIIKKKKININSR